MRIAFYAPMKPPDHAIPSGDRRIARLLIAALEAAGHEVLIAARLRSWDGAGDPGRQARIAALGERLAARLARRMPHADLWLTYHLYHKAPDWLGPAVAALRGIPYVVAEASVAGKRAGGAWDRGHRATIAALGRAAAVIGLNEADHEGVLPHLANSALWHSLPPFLDAARFAAPPRAPRAEPVLVAVAMMRPGDKLASFRLLGAALQRLLDRPWRLDIVGDGPARAEVEAALAPLGARVRYRGALDGEALAAALAAADLCVWPAVNEAFGMALLEAQAAGLAVVAGNEGGVSGVVADERTGLLTPPRDAGAFAAAVARLIDRPAERAAFGESAATHVRARHDIAAAARHLDAILSRACVRSPAAV